MIVVGITGGIASGKTTISNHLKSKKYPVHESDRVVKKIYLKPSKKLIKNLRFIGLGESVKNKKIDKNVIRKEIFFNKRKKSKLEDFIHKEVRLSRENFLKKNKMSKIVFLDIPLLFEKKLDKQCHTTILLVAPKKTRILRAVSRTGMKKAEIENIIKGQLSDKIKKNKADFVINTNTTIKKTLKKVCETVNMIKKKYA